MESILLGAKVFFLLTVLMVVMVLICSIDVGILLMRNENILDKKHRLEIVLILLAVRGWLLF